MYYPSSENKGADQLRGYHEADLRLCFRLCRLLLFPCGGSYSNYLHDDLLAFMIVFVSILLFLFPFLLQSWYIHTCENMVMEPHMASYVVSTNKKLFLHKTFFVVCVCVCMGGGGVMT